jgi:RNA polymerase sigma-70 factor, ECF subfamily
MEERDPALEELKTRNVEALRSWVDLYYDDIFRFMRHMTGHRETAEDLAQQVFVRAFEGLGRFRGDASMRTWLHQIAYREFVAWHRKHRWLEPLGFGRHAHDANIDRIDQSEALAMALRRIPAVNREAFLMFEVQDLSIDEIAEITGSPAGTVKSRLHEARKRLQLLLAPTFQEVPSGA